MLRAAGSIDRDERFYYGTVIETVKEQVVPLYPSTFSLSFILYLILYD